MSQITDDEDVTDGRFWLTATSQRKRIAAVRRDDRVAVVVTSSGTDLGPNGTKMGRATRASSAHRSAPEPATDT